MRRPPLRDHRGLSDFPPPDGILKDVHGHPQCQLELLGALREQPDQRWHGTVTNPEDGRTYKAEIWVPEDGILRLRGYLGIPLFGSTQKWPPFHGRVTADCHVLTHITE